MCVWTTHFIPNANYREYVPGINADVAARAKIGKQKIRVDIRVQNRIKSRAFEIYNVFVFLNFLKFVYCFRQLLCFVQLEY